MVKMFQSLANAVAFMAELKWAGKSSQVSFCDILGMFEVRWENA